MFDRSPIQVRWLIRDDMATVLRIEGQSFDRPWTEDDFLKCLRQRNCIGMVAERHERVVGFMLYELHKPRLRLLNFAVDPGVRRQGIGTRMMARLVDKLSFQRRTEISAAVSERNLDAHLFFRSMGFRATKVLRGWYREVGRDDDGYLFSYSLDDGDAGFGGVLGERLARKG